MAKKPTLAELTKRLVSVESELNLINDRTGAPKGYLPLHQLAKVITSVSEETIQAAILAAKVPVKVYTTATGAQIVGCRGYGVTKAKAAVKAYIKASFKPAKSGSMYKHEATGRKFLVK